MSEGSEIHKLRDGHGDGSGEDGGVAHVGGGEGGVGEVKNAMIEFKNRGEMIDADPAY